MGRYEEYKKQTMKDLDRRYYDGQLFSDAAAILYPDRKLRTNYQIIKSTIRKFKDIIRDDEENILENSVRAAVTNAILIFMMLDVVRQETEDLNEYATTREKREEIESKRR